LLTSYELLSQEREHHKSELIERTRPLELSISQLENAVQRCKRRWPPSAAKQSINLPDVLHVN
jgi:hypothetical protein